MATLITGKDWADKIWQIEKETPWVGGPEGTANVQAGQLGARTEYLKDFADELAEARDGEDTLLARLKKTGVDPITVLSKFGYIGDLPAAASTGNVDVAKGGPVEMDGIALKVGDLVLLKDQDEPRENGFWEVQTGAWNRYPGYGPEDADCFSYRLIPTKKGDANADKVFFLDRDIYKVGRDPLLFPESIFSPRGAPGKILLFDPGVNFITELKRQIREEEWPVGSLYIQHLNDASPVERGLPGEWAVWSHRADGYGLVSGALPAFTEFKQGDSWAKGAHKLWHIDGEDWRLFVANEAIANLPDPKYIDPVKCTPFQPAVIVERRELQGWTDADLKVGDVIKGGAYAGWKVCEVIVPGGKYHRVEGGLSPTFVSGGVAGDRIRNISGEWGVSTVTNNGANVPYGNGAIQV
ncbi:MAG: hypothetical protein FWD94_08185, partial [Treponema sp.]|nr:hypothetical protein [Treponema sp.]